MTLNKYPRDQSEFIEARRKFIVNMNSGWYWGYMKFKRRGIWILTGLFKTLITMILYSANFNKIMILMMSATVFFIF